jgi:2-oxoisovalerate dehydrogenase E1 component
MAFDDLDAPPVVVGSRNWITPAYEMEEYFFPQPSWILDAIHVRIVPLTGYKPTADWSVETQLKRSRLGV